MSDRHVPQLAFTHVNATFRPDTTPVGRHAPVENRGTHVAEPFGQPTTETEPRRLMWAKSSASSSGTSENCVEVATTASGVFLRDSKHPDPRLTFTREAWTTFVSLHS